MINELGGHLFSKAFWSVYPDTCEMLAILTWTCSFSFWWSQAILGSSGHSVTCNGGSGRQPPDTDTVVLDVSHLHLGWFVNFCKWQQGEMSEATVYGIRLDKSLSLVTIHTGWSLMTPRCFFCRNRDSFWGQGKHLDAITHFQDGYFTHKETTFQVGVYLLTLSVHSFIH